MPTVRYVLYMVARRGHGATADGGGKVHLGFHTRNTQARGPRGEAHIVWLHCSRWVPQMARWGQHSELRWYCARHPPVGCAVKTSLAYSIDCIEEINKHLDRTGIYLDNKWPKPCSMLYGLWCMLFRYGIVRKVTAPAVRPTLSSTSTVRLNGHTAAMY